MAGRRLRSSVLEIASAMFEPSLPTIVRPMPLRNRLYSTSAFGLRDTFGSPAASNLSTSEVAVARCPPAEPPDPQLAPCFNLSAK